MFENLLGQDEVAALLRADLEGGSLPPALLFSGPPATGKLTAALELARVLSCEAAGRPRAAWNCPCPACARHRALAHPDLLLLGKRSFPEEIEAALGLLGRAPGRASAYFFVRALRKLGKRFDAALYEGEEARLAKAAPLLREIEERLSLFEPERAGASSLPEGFLPTAEAAALAARKLEAFVPEAPPVFQIRAAERWARLAPWGRRKAVLIENAEGMQDSARNALLKILEEPPPTVVYVLLSSRRRGLIRTVLSRVRPYAFKPRDGASSALVLERVFREGGAASLEGVGPAVLSVEAYLAALRPFPPERARELAESLLGAALAARREAGAALEPALEERARRAEGSGLDLPAALAGLLAATKDFGQKDEALGGSFPAFLAGLDEALRGLLREEGLGPGGAAWAAYAAELAREARQRRESYNLSASLLAESLAYALGEP